MKIWAKHNNLARKLEKAIERCTNSQDWDAFVGLDKGEARVRVVLEGGQITFKAIRKAPKKKKVTKPKEEPPKEEEPPEGLPLDEGQITDSDAKEYAKNTTPSETGDGHIIPEG